MFNIHPHLLKTLWYKGLIMCYIGNQFCIFFSRIYSSIEFAFIGIRCQIVTYHSWWSLQGVCHMVQSCPQIQFVHWDF